MPSQDSFRNIMLRSLPGATFDILRPSLKPLAMGRGDTLIRQGAIIDRVVFPETAVCGLVVSGQEGSSVEVGMFGSEGCSDMVMLPGVDISTFSTTVYIPGQGYTVSANAYAKAIHSSAKMLEITLRFQQALTTQLVFTSLSNASLTVQQRVSRWLIMLQDRIGNCIPITQEKISESLCVTRTPVVEALHALQNAEAIQARRGSIVIVDRNHLVRQANGTYGFAEAEYERVIGRFRA